MAKTLRTLGVLLAVTGMLSGTWLLAQWQASGKPRRAPASEEAAKALPDEPGTMQLAVQLAQRLATARADAAPTTPVTTKPGQGAVPDDLERVEEFKRQVNERAERTAALVRSPSDLEPVLSEIEHDIERSRRVTAFHAKSAVAAVRAAYRDGPEEEREARLLELDRRLMELSAKYDPLVREGRVAGAPRQDRFN